MQDTFHFDLITLEGLLQGQERKVLETLNCIPQITVGPEMLAALIAKARSGWFKDINP